ncbi:MAG: polysaccharide biosynthesis protein [Verrucomicrobia bacterium]|nr:polysaccharide biosynthesis protein [Verrucomicrobiota bacterium]
MLILVYGIVLWLAHWLAFQLRFDFAVPESSRDELNRSWLWEVPFKLIVLAWFGQFSGLLSYFSVPDFLRILAANALVSGIMLVGRLLPVPIEWDPRGVVMLDFFLSVVGLSAVRLGFRLVRERYLMDDSPPRQRKRVAIIGAGDVGASLAKELLARKGLGMEPVAFFDDDAGKWHSRVHGIPVRGAPDLLRREHKNLALDEAVIAMPSVSARRMGELVRLLTEVGLRFETVPSYHQLATGKVRVSRLRPVEIEDLLGREEVELKVDNIRRLLADRVVAVTGAGGSIGSELCRQIADFNPKRLLLIEQSEVQIFQIEQELVRSGHGGTILPLVADILDQPRMRFILERFRPEVIFHAAAHKHVPMMESQPGEAIKNNSLGTAKLAELALVSGVDRFVLISTDKAINPTNVMGASKRLAEMYVQALHAANPGRTKFMAVRFGNVLGSSGSVVPTFKKQIEAGGPVTITHAEVTRYFMTIPEAVGLVLQSAALGEGGEIFVLDMGKPVKIVDLARQLIELSGLRPGEDIEIQFTGLRPGEKLFEEITHQGEDFRPTDHPKIMRFVTTPPPVERLRAALDELVGQMHVAEPNQFKLEIQRIVPEYKPYLT